MLRAADSPPNLADAPTKNPDSDAGVILQPDSPSQLEAEPRSEGQYSRRDSEKISAPERSSDVLPQREAEAAEQSPPGIGPARLQDDSALNSCLSRAHAGLTGVSSTFGRVMESSGTVETLVPAAGVTVGSPRGSQSVHSRWSVMRLILTVPPQKALSCRSHTSGFRRKD